MVLMAERLVATRRGINPIRDAAHAERARLANNARLATATVEYDASRPLRPLRSTSAQGAPKASRTLPRTPPPRSEYPDGTKTMPPAITGPAALMLPPFAATPFTV